LRVGILTVVLETDTTSAMPSISEDAALTLLVRVRLALGAYDFRLGEDSDIGFASRLAAIMSLRFKGILPLSSRMTRSCIETSPEALRRDFCFAFHACLF